MKQALPTLGCREREGVMSPYPRSKTILWTEELELRELPVVSEVTEETLLDSPAQTSNRAS